MESTATRNLQIGYGLSFLLLLLSSVASYVSIDNLLTSSRLVNHTNKVILELENTISILKDAETGQRGFLLTGQEQFLEPYYGAYDRAEMSINNVRKYTIDNAQQQKNADQLENIVLNRIKRLNTLLQVKKSQKKINAQEMLNGKLQMDAARLIVKRMIDTEQRLLDARTHKINQFALFTPALIIFATLLSFIITFISYIRAKRDFEKRAELYTVLEQKDKETTERISIIEGIADKVSSGDYDVRVEDQDAKDSLGSLASSLNKMAESLHFSFSSLSDKEWLQTGIAGLNQVMVGEKDIKTLTNNVLEYMVNYTDSQVGAFYLLNNTDILVLEAGYALNHSRNEKIRLGEGLAGQCALSKKELYVKEISSENITFSYASGDAKPGFVIAVPILNEDDLKGVIELASFSAFSDQDFEYIKGVSHNIGIALNTAQNRNKLQQLLEETQAQAEELQAQHSELENLNTELEAQAQKLQASEEELKVQQEELLEANQELEERSKMLEEKNQLIVERNLDIHKKAEELEQSTKYKSEFLANMSHELRTPLNSILLLSRLMAENTEQNLSEDQIEYAKVIQSSGNGLLSLIDEILDLSKIEAGKMDLEIAELPVKTIIYDMQSLFAPIARQKNLNFSIDVSGSVPDNITTDKMRLEQILKNLLSNALKFTPKGSIKLAIDMAENEPLIHFSVKDTGIGIPEDKQQHVFEAFQQADGSTRRKFGGTGLGLSISRELAKLLGGEISLKSEPGKGSNFTLTIPLEITVPAQVTDKKEPAQLPAPQIPSEDKNDKEDRKKFTVSTIPQPIDDDREAISEGDKVILIVEDDTTFAKALLSFTRRNGYKCLVAVRGDDGIELAKKYKPAAVLLDIQLPVMDGWEVMEALKTSPLTRHIPVHIMSSLEAKRESLVKGAVDFINKPVAAEHMTEMFKKLEDALNRSPKKVLIIEENQKHAQALAYFLESFNVTSEIKTSVSDGVSALQKKEVDCVILDMGIPDHAGYETLEAVKKNKGLENLPIIIFTGKNLSKAEESKLKQYADSIVMKTAHSYQRILDEVGLFLHLVEEKKNTPNGDKRKNLLGLNEVLENKTVLIADDDVRNIFSLTKALEQLKMKVVSATDGKEALRFLEENPATDVVLMDMMMPEMDGYETTTRIRQNPKFRNIPILAVTAKAMIGDREKCIRAGASDYISKPVDIDQLISLLRVWLYDKHF